MTLEIKKGDAKSFTVDVSGISSLTGFTPYIKIEDFSRRDVFSKALSATDLSINVNLYTWDTSLDRGDYIMNIFITDDASLKYTLIQDRIIIFE